MKKILPLLVLALGLAGCNSRSISNSGYGDAHGWRTAENFSYRGELSEFDILGTSPAGDATEENIAKALAAAAAPSLKRGDKVLMIQSGAPVPDHAMLEEAARYFAVAPFSGVSPGEKQPGLSASLRLRAAQGGYRHLVCYWGVLESAQMDREGKAVSWVPFVGGLVPDQKQQMRIRLKALLVDVATGNWKMLTPEVHNDEGYNSRWTREEADQRLVEALKQKGYRSLVAELVRS